MIDSNKVRLAYWASADGPRVMMFGPMQTDLESLRECFLELSKGESEMTLDSLPFIHSVGVRLRLRSLGELFRAKEGDARQGLRRQSSDDESFVWSRTNEGWEYLAELLDGLIQSQKPGHQYMTRFPDEEAIIVVSKGEYADDVLTA